MPGCSGTGVAVAAAYRKSPHIPLNQAPPGIKNYRVANSKRHTLNGGTWKSSAESSVRTT